MNGGVLDEYNVLNRLRPEGLLPAQIMAFQNRIFGRPKTLRTDRCYLIGGGGFIRDKLFLCNNSRWFGTLKILFAIFAIFSYAKPISLLIT